MVDSETSFVPLDVEPKLTLDILQLISDHLRSSDPGCRATLSSLSRCSRDLNDLLAPHLYRHITLGGDEKVGRLMTSMAAAHDWVEERERTKARYALRPPRLNSTLTPDPHIIPVEHVQTITINSIPCRVLRENLAKFSRDLMRPFIFPNVQKIMLAANFIGQLAGENPPTWKRTRDNTASKKNDSTRAGYIGQP